MTGWTFEQYDEAPAVRVDWLLAIGDAVNAAQQNKARAQAKTANRRPR